MMPTRAQVVFAVAVMLMAGCVVAAQKPLHCWETVTNEQQPWHCCWREIPCP